MNDIPSFSSTRCEARFSGCVIPTIHLKPIFRIHEADSPLLPLVNPWPQKSLPMRKLTSVSSVSGRNCRPHQPLNCFLKRGSTAHHPNLCSCQCLSWLEISCSTRSWSLRPPRVRSEMATHIHVSVSADPFLRCNSGSLQLCSPPDERQHCMQQG